MDILDILKKYNITVDEQTATELNKDLRKNYKSVAEFQELKNKLDAYTNRPDFEAQYNALKTEYDEYKTSKEKETLERDFDTKLTSALDGIEFSSARVKNSVISEIKSKGLTVGEDGAIAGLTDYLKELYKTEPDNFKSVNSELHTWVGGSDPVKTKEESKASNIFNRIF